MTTFVGPPGPDYFRFSAAVALTQESPSAWDAARALAPQIAADIDVATARSAQADIEPQMTPAQLATTAGSFAYGFTGKAAAEG